MLSALNLVPVAFIIALLYRKWRYSSRRYPPGPKPLPLIGNVLDVPKVRPWYGYRELCEKYGDLVFFHLPMQPVLVLGSAEAVTDILEKRSNISADRLQLRMMKLLSWDFNLGVKPYGTMWKSQRRLFHHYFSQHEIPAYRDVQLEEVRAFLLQVLNRPRSADRHIRQVVASTILRIVYGRKVTGLDDEYVLLAEEAVEAANTSVQLNGVEFLPFLQYIPAWLPGGRTRRLINKFKPIVDAMLDLPLNELKSAISNGTAIPCVATTIITELQERHGNGPLPDDEEHFIREVTGSAYFGYADTGSCAGNSFMLAMALYPEVQRKAQEELDRVVGSDRLPDFKDLPSLVYIQAITMELLRWMPVAPLALPHRLTEDDEYKGYFIPKGTLVVPNSWAILRNPDDYPQPDAFIPDRYIKDGKIDPNVRDPSSFAFGYGRRVCPGRHLANVSLQLLIASTLHVFNISPGFNDDGKPVSLCAEVCDGFISHPLTVPRGVEPRSKTSERLVRDACGHS